MADVTNVKTLTPEALERALDNLSPEQLALIRGKAMAAGFKAASPSGYQEHADGSITVTITIPAEVAPNLLTWGHDNSNEEFVKEQVLQAIDNHIVGSWSMPEPPAAAKPIPVSGVPAGTPAAAK